MRGAAKSGERKTNKTKTQKTIMRTLLGLKNSTLISAKQLDSAQKKEPI
jgi:hypothetical protein